jgi:hypothetical protein
MKEIIKGNATEAGLQGNVSNAICYHTREQQSMNIS